MSQTVNSTLDLETVLSTIVAKAVQLSGTEAGAIYVFDDRQREFYLRATYGMDQELIEALTHQRIGFDEPNVVHGHGDTVDDADQRAGADARQNAQCHRHDRGIGMSGSKRRHGQRGYDGGNRNDLTDRKIETAGEQRQHLTLVV